MYIPSYANPPNETFLKDLVNNYPFVTLISVDENSEPYITHLPVVAQFDGADQLVKIQGHLSKFNPHFEILQKNKLVKVIFNGPHQYISPRWYKSGRDVPTWAYCVVHVQGELTLEDSFED
ncbi:MAG: FMN-binding negative transcriptional regulator, partial [Pseudobdellovibrio sp.]